MINKIYGKEKIKELGKDLKEKINNLVLLYSDFVSKIDNDFNCYIRFNDYFDENSDCLSNIEYFKLFNFNEDILIYYINFIVDKLLKELFYILSDNDFDIKNLLEILTDKNIIEEATVSINYALNLLNNNTDENKIDFLNEDNQYKIMFTKMANEDIKSLPKNVLSAFIRKLYFPLSIQSIINLRDRLGHTNDTYNTNYFRIQFADDYRIAYFREKNVTIILGVTIKSGHNADYTRYGVCAKKNDYLLKQVDDFIKGIYSSEHLDTINFLKKYITNKKNKIIEK